MPAPDLDALLAAVDASRLMRDVEQLTRVERTPGEAGEREAFADIANALAAVGLTPLSGTLPAYVSVPESASLRVNGEIFSCTTHAMLPGIDLEADILDVPDLRSLGRGDVRGRIVLLDGLAMAPSLRAAQEAGAVGVIFIAGSRCHHEMIVSTVWGSPEPADLGRYLALPAVTLCHAEGEKLREMLGKGPASAHMQTRVRAFWTDLPYLTADIGPVHKGYALLTGHVDSWHKGAMDNASGNAAALEIARILAPVASALRRGVRLVFWSGHSHGRYAGSTAFCDAFFHDLYDNAFLHVNADCLGGCGATLLSQGACMAETWALGDFALHHVTGEHLEGTRFGRSCDQSFWGTGTPSLFSSVSEQPKPETDDAASRAFSLMFGGSKSGGYGWWWHTEADTADKLDPTHLQRDTRIFLAVLHKALTEALLPLDIRAGFADLATHIRAYAKLAAKHGETAGAHPLDMASLLNDVHQLETTLENLNLAALPADQSNRLILRFEKRLVPLLYVKGSPFGHDPALRQAPLPLLEELHSLGETRDPHHKNSLLTLLRRRLNAVRQGVKELAAIVG